MRGYVEKLCAEPWLHLHRPRSNLSSQKQSATLLLPERTAIDEQQRVLLSFRYTNGLSPSASSGAVVPFFKITETYSLAGPTKMQRRDLKAGLQQAAASIPASGELTVNISWDAPNPGDAPPHFMIAIPLKVLPALGGEERALPIVCVELCGRYAGTHATNGPHALLSQEKRALMPELLAV